MIRYFTNSGELLRNSDYVLREIPVEPFYEVVECKTGKVLNLHFDKKGYIGVYIYFNRKRVNCGLHRLILSTFDPIGYFDGAQVNHIDEVKTNNKLSNLEWLSCKDNINHGTHNQRVADSLSKSVLQYTKSGTLITEYPSIIEAHRQTGVNIGNICSCCNEKYKLAGGFIWRYK